MDKKQSKTGLIAGIIIIVVIIGGIIFGVGHHKSNDSMMKKNSMASSSMMMKKDKMMAMMSGSFMGQNKMMVKGSAQIKDNKLMLTDFSSSKGPDLHVYLTKDGDIENGYEVAAVKYNEATQTFDLDSSMNLADYNQVNIYCDKAHVTFGTAELAA